MEKERITIKLHPSGFLCQDLTAPFLLDGASPFPSHYRGLYHYLDDPFCGARADRDRACRALHERAFSRQVEGGLYVLTPLMTDADLIRDYREACHAMDIPTRWLFLSTDAPSLRCDMAPLPPMRSLGYEVFHTEAPEGLMMEELFVSDISTWCDDEAKRFFAAHRAHLNENGLFTTAEDCRAYLDAYARLSMDGAFGDMEPGEEEDFCVAAIYEVNFPPL